MVCRGATGEALKGVEPLFGVCEKKFEFMYVVSVAFLMFPGAGDTV